MKQLCSQLGECHECNTNQKKQRDSKFLRDMCSFLEDLRGTAQAFPSESKERFGPSVGWDFFVPRVRWSLRVVTPDQQSGHGFIGFCCYNWFQQSSLCYFRHICGSLSSRLRIYIYIYICPPPFVDQKSISSDMRQHEFACGVRH